MNEIFGYVSGALGLFSFIPYFLATLNGTSRPEKVSWFAWVLVDLILLFAQVSEGASNSLYIAASFLIGDLIIFLLSFKYGYSKKLLLRDYFGLAGIVATLFLWHITGSAALTIFAAVVIDCIGAVLTVVKAHEDPKSENQTRWILDFFAAVFACLAVGKFDLVLLIFPVYVLVESATIVTVIKLSLRKNKV